MPYQDMIVGHKSHVGANPEVYTRDYYSALNNLRGSTTNTDVPRQNAGFSIVDTLGQVLTMKMLESSAATPGAPTQPQLVSMEGEGAALNNPWVIAAGIGALAVGLYAMAK